MNLKVCMSGCRRFIAVWVLMLGGVAFGTKTFVRPDTPAYAYDGGFISSASPVLVFPGAKLAEFEGCFFYGIMGGVAFGTPSLGCSNVPTVYPLGATGEAVERIEFDVCTQDGVYTKATHLQLTQRADGVYAQSTKAYYLSAKAEANIYYTIAVDGTVNWKNGPNYVTPATGPSTGDYGVRSLRAGHQLSTTSHLTFAGTTVAEIWSNERRLITAKICGGQMISASNNPWTITNLTVTATNDAAEPTALRFECQRLDGTWLKCAVVELIDGEGGVWAKQSPKTFYAESASHALGFHFLDAAGTVASGVNESTTDTSGFWMGTYNVWNLTLTLNAPDVYRPLGDPNMLWDQRAYLSGTPICVFPNVELADLVDCTFYGMMDGLSIANGGVILPNSASWRVIKYPEGATGENLTHLFFELAHYDGTYTKWVLVELTKGTGGVFAAARMASYRSGFYLPNAAFTVTAGANGPVLAVASGMNKSQVSTSDHIAGYGLKSLGATKVISSTPTLVFPGMTVEQIAHARFFGKTAGGSIGGSIASDYVMNDAIVGQVDSMGRATKIYVEGQFLDGKYQYTKGVLITLMDGEGGVYAALTNTGFVDGHHPGMRLFTDSGERAGGVSAISLPATACASGYAVICFALELDETVVATASWTGGAGTGDMNDPANWDCRTMGGTQIPNALPDENTVVTISRSLTMSADGDLSMVRRLTMPSDVVITLNGHVLKVKTLVDCASATITGVGELHFVVPAGFESRNTSVTLSGALKVVKEGKGAFCAAKVKQPYRGGNEIREGTFFLSEGPGLWAAGGDGVQNMTASTNTVLPGAVFDLNGMVGWGYNTINLAGGTLLGATSQLNCKVILSADSRIEASGHLTVPDYAPKMDLNGHTLTMSIEYGMVFSSGFAALENGTLDIVKGGYFQTAKALAAPTVDFKVNAALRLTNPLSVHDYYAGYNSTANDGTAALNVYGTFTPAVKYFYGCTLMDGAAIDLSEKDVDWSTTSAFTTGANTLTFEANARVAVKLGSRELAEGDRVMVWTDENAPVNVKFLGEGTVFDGNRYDLTAKPDGLYLAKKYGIVIYIR